MKTKKRELYVDKKLIEDCSIRFDQLDDGTYFKWAGVTHRKLPMGYALRLEDDVILFFGADKKCLVIPKPTKRMDLILQYLHWALIQAHSENNRNSEIEKVVVTLFLDTQTSTTSVIKRRKVGA